MKRLFILLGFIFVILFPGTSHAQSAVLSDWVIRDFKSEITVNQDSTADITESITADCANLPGKHGIFRIVPAQIKIDNGTTMETPIKLISITDFDGKAIKYTSSNDTLKHTLTWKIGDADVLVTGVNDYKIHYRVGNVIRHQGSFDEFYWNLSGNQWTIPVENFIGKVTLPAGIQLNQKDVSIYSGPTGNKTAGKATFTISNNQINVLSNAHLNPGEGVTLSVSTLPNTFAVYKPPFYIRYKNLAYLFPILVFILCLISWFRYGRDPHNKTIVPEFAVPDNLDPMTMGSILKQGGFEQKSIPAAIVNFAVNKMIQIKELPKEGIFGKKDFLLTKKYKDEDLKKLSWAERLLLDTLFTSRKEVKISDLKEDFITTYQAIAEQAHRTMEDGGYMDKKSKSIQSNLILWTLIIGIPLVFLSFILHPPLSFVAAFVITVIILKFFILIAPRFTEKGREINRKIAGFKLFITVADRYKAKFDEENNIFEKFLPYAILFGLTKQWIKTMKKFYGNDYFTTHPMYFYVGASGNIGDFESFASVVDSVSSSISSSTGAGGAGGSGGGGGGGGGGGW